MIKIWFDELWFQLLIYNVGSSIYIRIYWILIEEFWLIRDFDSPKPMINPYTNFCDL